MMDASCMAMNRTPLSKMIDVARSTSDLLSDGQVSIESDSFWERNFLITTGHTARMIWNVLKVLDRKSSPKPKALRTLEVGEEG